MQLTFLKKIESQKYILALTLCDLTVRTWSTVQRRLRMHICENKLRVWRRIITIGGETTPEKEEVRLVFGKLEPKMIETAKALPKPLEDVAFELNELLGWFKSFKVDSIELSIEGSVKSGGFINLIVSAEGKGGMKVILKPKP